MKARWRDLLDLIRSLLVDPQKREDRVKARPSGPRAEEAFHLDLEPGGSVLFGKFQVGDRMILVSHRQWDGDSHPLNLSQRKEILRKTLVERLRRASSHVRSFH